MKTKLKLLICSLLLMCGLSFAQQTGTTDFGAADSFAVDSIDLTTLTPSINVPVNSKKGAIPFAYSIRLSTYCQVIGQNTGQTTTCYPPTQLGTLGSLIGSSVAYYTTIPLGGNCYQFQDFYITDSSGTVHNLPHADALDNCASNNFTDAAYDSSGLTLNASVTTNGNGGAVFTYSLLDANGHYTEQETGGGIVFLSETDAFGNQIKGVGSSYIDTLNTSALTFVSNGYQWLDASGTGQTLTVTKGTGLSINKGSNFNCYSNPNTGTSYPLTFGYPDGTSIGIGLEQGAGGTGTTTGRIGSVTLRTGATISYSYGAFYLCPSYNADGPVYPSSLTRTTPDGTTTYTITSVNTTTKITPDGNKTVYTYQAAQAAVVGPPYVTPAYPAALLQVQFYQNTGSVSSPVYVITKTVTYCYNGNQTNCSTSGVSYPIVQRDVYTELWNTAGTSGVTSRQTLMFDANESVTSASNYDFGASSWTTQTNITYGSWNGSSCTAVGSSILTLPCDVVTTDGTHTLAETRKTYNSSGGLLSSSTWTGSTWLTDTYTVNSNGTLASSTAANGLYATYSQSGGCNGLFNTSTNATVSSGDILTSSIGWNCDIGAVTSLTDNNGNSISATSFDSMLRPLSSTDESGLTSTSSYTANSKSITTAFSTYSSTSTASVDSLGRAVLSQTTNGNSYDTLSASHRFVGINFVEGSAVPCAQSTLGAGCTITANAYKDVLGRTVKYTDGNGKLVTTVYSLNDVQTTAGPAPTGEHTKTVQTEYDGLGRVKSVCALQTSGGSSCGQAMGGSGILTTYTYTFGAGTTTVTATRGSETKSSTMDAKGRTVSSTTPEAGTSTYTYDSTTSGPCGAVTSLGDLISVNVSGSYTRCYSYDKMHRTTDVTTTLSSPAGYCKRFRYDNSTGVLGTLPSGVTVANNLGRMVEAETDNCTLPITSATILTDEWFSYDKNGRMVTLWERTPTQTSYYKTAVSYFLNGAPDVLTIPGYTITYGLNSNGRLNTATKGSSYKLVSGVVYGPVGPTSISIGAGSDYDTYSYDANTGAMKQYQYFVGSANYKGILTWNSIGSLSSTAVTDGFNSGNTQTCTYTHDDVNRLTGDNCGSGWTQTYSNDQYNNLTKAGSVAFNPGYNTKNQYTTIGATYDAAGNLTYDGTNNITWDSFGKMSSFAGVSFVYDAFGNSVKNSAGKDILYGPLGKIGVITYPSTYGNTYIPLPGGGSYSALNNHYTHRDVVGTSAIASTVPSSGNGAVVSDVLFAPYGDQYDPHGSAMSPVMFAGNASDLSSSLYDTPNRELSVVGRWLSPDPAGASWNAYAYAPDPTTQTDNSGLMYLTKDGSGTGSAESEWVDDGNQSLWNGGAGLGGCNTATQSCAHPMLNSIQYGSLHQSHQNGYTIHIDTYLSDQMYRELEEALNADQERIERGLNAVTDFLGEFVCNCDEDRLSHGDDHSGNAILAMSLMPIGEGEEAAEARSLGAASMGGIEGGNMTDAYLNRMWQRLDVEAPEWQASGLNDLSKIWERAKTRKLSAKAAHDLGNLIQSAGSYIIDVPNPEKMRLYIGKASKFLANQ